MTEQTIVLLLLPLTGLLFGHHVEGPAGQLTGQADVLSVAADGLGQVVLSNRDFHGVAVFVHDDRRHFRRSHGINHQLGGIVVVQHDIHTLTRQFIGDSLYAGAAHTNTGAHRVNTAVVGFHCNLGP